MHNFHSNEYATASDAVSGFSPNGTWSLASLFATVDDGILRKEASHNSAEWNG